MRELGYPPGWLREAEIGHSGISLFVAQNESLPDHGDEDGEITSAEDKIRYDTSKIVEWPGFNVDFPADFRDETRKYGVPFMQDDHSKEAMIRGMEPREQKGYVRGEMQDTSTKKADKNSADSSSIDEPVETEVEKVEEAVKLVDQVPAQPSEVTSVDAGTPICTLYSPFDALPAQEKWTTNTTDHIMFENLPEATGKYDSMLEVLKKVRTHRKETQPK